MRIDTHLVRDEFVIAVGALFGGLAEVASIMMHDENIEAALSGLYALFMPVKYYVWFSLVTFRRFTL